MSLVQPNEGAQEALARMLNKSATGDVVLRLFKNNYTPVKGATVASFTEADFTGYAAKTLTGASWSITSANPAVASYAKQTFTCSGGAAQSVYGYYVTNGAGTKVLWAELFTDGPYAIDPTDHDIEVTPVYTQA